MFSYRPPIREPGVMRSARTRTSSSQMELQHKIQTLDEIPELSTHHLASLTHWRQATPSTIRSCWLQPKLHQGNICYIFHNIFLSVVTLYDIQAAVLFLYNDNIQAPEVPGPSCQWPCDGCNDGVVSHLLSENCKFLLYRNSFILSRGSES